MLSATISGLSIYVWQLKKNQLKINDYVIVFIGISIYISGFLYCHSWIGKETFWVYTLTQNLGASFISYGLISITMSLLTNLDLKKEKYLKSISLIIISFLCLAEVSTNFYREPFFDSKNEFFRASQDFKNSIWIQIGILCFKLWVVFQIIVTYLLYFLNRNILSPDRKRIAKFFIGAISFLLIIVALLILSDSELISPELFKFTLVNGSNFIVIYILLMGLYTESIPIKVGLKTLLFNLTILYLTISFISSFLTIQYNDNLSDKFDLESGFVKNQIEHGIRSPAVSLSDFIANRYSKEILINKTEIPFIFLPPDKHFNMGNLKLISLDSAVGEPKLFLISHFLAKNSVYVIGIDYLKIRKETSIYVWKLFIGFLLCLSFVFITYPFLHERNIVTPLLNLLEGIRSSKDGSIEFKSIPIAAQDEIGEITINFNEMMIKIRDYQEGLENKIKARTQELIEAERMGTLGKISASVAHEINNPLAAITVCSDRLQKSLESSYWTDHNEQEKALLNSLITNQEIKSLSHTEKRKTRKEIMRFLEEFEIAQADYLADICIDIGVYSIDPIWISFLNVESNRSSFARFLDKAVALHQVRIIQLAVQRSSKLVTSLKHYSYLPSQRQRSKVKIKDGIETVLTIYSNFFKKGIELSKDYSVNPEIEGEPEELIQVWSNLIFNAIQAISDSNGKIQITLSEDDKRAYVSIQDSGTGIPPEKLDKIFQAFYTTKEIGVGTGLGLSIVKKIVEQHSGTISVESKVGRTVFKVSLPKFANQKEKV